MFETVRNDYLADEIGIRIENIVLLFSRMDVFYLVHKNNDKNKRF